MDFSKFVLKEYKAQIWAAVIVFGTLVILSLIKDSWHQKIAWFEAIAGFGTLLFAFFFWLNSLNMNWRQSLPNRMTVQYRFDGRNVMVCKGALLTSESDARTWALQIGQQMSGCQRLKFSPFFNFEKKGVGKFDDKKCNKYVFTYYLTELPVPDIAKDNSTPLSEFQTSFRDKLANGCIFSTPDYADDGTVTFIDEYKPSSGQAIRT